VIGYALLTQSEEHLHAVIAALAW
jgi:hypothetical protein